MDNFQQGLIDLAQYNKQAESLYSQNLRSIADANRLFLIIIVLSILLGIILAYIIENVLFILAEGFCHVQTFRTASSLKVNIIKYCVRRDNILFG